MLGRCKRALARAAPATSKKITGTRGTGDRMRRFMLMLSFDSPPPHWWLTPGGANATRLSNLPYSRRQVSVTHSLRSGFWLFYCLTRGSATSSLHPALTAAVLRDSKFRSLCSPLNSKLAKTLGLMLWKIVVGSRICFHWRGGHDRIGHRRWTVPTGHAQETFYTLKIWLSIPN